MFPFDDVIMPHFHDQSEFKINININISSTDPVNIQDLTLVNTLPVYVLVHNGAKTSAVPVLTTKSAMFLPRFHGFCDF